jgi:Contractile injection system tube protein/LysM domain
MQLEKALIINTRTQEHIKVMFNPEEYSLDSANTFAEVGIPGLARPPIQYVRGNLRTLKMELFFDTYEDRSDVREHTGKIVALLEKDPALKAPPILLFSWGMLNFKCVLDNVGQKFTMFLSEGIPVRATLSVTFKEYEEAQIEITHGLFVGPPTVQNIVDGQTLSGIAGEILGDPGAWREIAELNNIDDPRKIKPGTPLIIPSRKRLTKPA